MPITLKSVRGKRGQIGSALVKRSGFGKVVLTTPTVPSLEVN